MQAGELISEQYAPLRRTDTVSAALELMNACGTADLPVVENHQLLGYARAADIFAEDPDATLAAVLEFPAYPAHAITHQHLYEIVPVFAALQTTTLAVTDADHRYIGMIDLRHLNEVISRTLTYKGVGSIIELEIGQRDFSPAELTRLVEMNDCKVVGMVVNELESGNLQVFIKLNTTALRAVIATFERFNYRIVNTFLREDINNGDDERFRAFLKFLDI
jgi:acetoin utilization protein AcuB